MQTLHQNKWLWFAAEDLETELRQLEEEGRDLARIRPRLRRLIRLGDEALATPKRQAAARDLLDEARALPTRSDFPYVEPSDLPAIRKARTRSLGAGAFKATDKPLGAGALMDRIHGAWLGRCIGCFLGKPLEGVKSDQFWPWLEATGQYPLRDYVTVQRHTRANKRYPDVGRRHWCEGMRYMPIDDDTNYTLAGLLIVERHGADFTPAEVGQFWLDNIPLLATCTAERVAYRNLALGIAPPESALAGNPYREWIGAQIRPDAYGYLCAGDPARAAEWAWRDASLSHVKNGIYGAMWAAACIAAAPVAKTPRAILEAGLGEIPAASRLHAALRARLEAYDAGQGYEEAVRDLHERWDENRAHDWCHTISNAEICALALLHGGGDFGDSVCKAVWPCFDTDCNGATVGSILGAHVGAKKIPAPWRDRLEDTLRTSLDGHHEVSIAALAARTVALRKRLG